MQLHGIGKGIKGFATVADRALCWDMICPSAEDRLRVLQFWERHGLDATREAFGVSRRTLFAWRAQLRAGGGQPHHLAPRSTRPHHLRRRQWPIAVIEYGNLGKEKLHRFVYAFCQQHGYATPSSRTIGRLIADSPTRCAKSRAANPASIKDVFDVSPVTVNPRAIDQSNPAIASPGTASNDGSLENVGI